jgi:hypothetical protein
MKNLLLRIFNRIKNPVTVLLLLILPPSLMLLVSMINWLMFWVSNDVDILIFQWTAFHYVIWLTFGCIAGAFYMYHILFKRSYLYLLGVPFQIGIFIFTWFWWLIISGPLDRFDTLEIEDTSYHLIQTSSHGNGQLYLFACDQDFCAVSIIGNVDSSKFFGAEMTYNSPTNTIYVTADLGFDKLC